MSTVNSTISINWIVHAHSIFLTVCHFYFSLALDSLENQAIHEAIMTFFDTLRSYGGENETTHQFSPYSNQIVRIITESFAILHTSSFCQLGL